MLPRLRPGPAAVGATALASAAVAVGGLIVAASVSSPAPQEAMPAAAAVAPVDPTPTSPPSVEPAPAAAPVTRPPATSEEPAPARHDGPVLVVGDSISLGSTAALKAALGADTTVDAEVGRQFATGVPKVRAWAARNPGPIVVDLGANGTVSAADVDAVLDAAGDRPVVLVGTCVPRVWQNSNNAILEAAAARAGSHVVFLDWASVVRSAGAGILGTDHVHPTPAGRTVLATAIRDALARAA
ncbi:putative acyltransferase [Pseudonocardia dioxanivorans CB1190]|uniref:Acyltransferase n=2 Tax=Pseudonocardia dioxanivorans TaxID=240495 RepID=F4CPM2_PSEUX|nr:acyltransferase [Pseudonocardia dioxanivorans]AEA25139.1 putative acyltransferase [Pseudonocardia dioxanivorans CB1190]